MAKIAIVTGATGGLGQEFIKEIQKIDEIDEIWAVIFYHSSCYCRF